MTAALVKAPGPLTVAELAARSMPAADGSCAPSTCCRTRASSSCAGVRCASCEQAVTVRDAVGRAAEESDAGRRRRALAPGDDAGLRRDDAAAGARYLLGYFGEQLDADCGNCDTCRSGSAARSHAAGDAGTDDDLAVDDRVEHAEWGGGTVMSLDGDRLTVFFDSRATRPSTARPSRRTTCSPTSTERPQQDPRNLYAWMSPGVQVPGYLPEGGRVSGR